MPEIPLPSTSAPPSIVYERKRKYSGEELATFKFDPTLLTLPEIRLELNYYKDNKDYRGPRTVPNKVDGIRLLTLGRSVVLLSSDQREQAAPATVVGTNTSRQILPEGATVVRRPGEVPRIPDLDADRPSNTRAAQRPDLIAPWTEWDDNNRKGEPLPNITPEDKAKVKQLKKQIGKWLEDDRPTRQQADQIGDGTHQKHQRSVCGFTQIHVAARVGQKQRRPNWMGIGAIRPTARRQTRQVDTRACG